MIVSCLVAGLAWAELELPRPTGPHRVGTRLLHWVDDARPEPGTSDEWDARELVVQVWYPADSGREGERAPYVIQLDALLACGLFDAADGKLAREVRAHAELDAPVAITAGRIPVVVLSTGNGEHAFSYTALAEELASHALLVVGLSHPGVADVVFPDGRALRRYARLFDPKPAGWDAALDAKASLALKRALYDGFYEEAAEVLAGDVSFALDELERLDREEGGPFAGRLDLARVATFGHSYGGNVAVEAAARDARVRACVSWDGGSFGPVRERGLTRPLLLLRPAFENDGTPRGVAQEQLLGSMRADAWEVNLAGAEHRSCMDVLRPSDEPSAGLAPARALEITSRLTRAFLAHVLDGAPSTALDEAADEAPQVFVRKVEFPERRFAELRAVSGRPEAVASPAAR